MLNLQHVKREGLPVVVREILAAHRETAGMNDAVASCLVVDMVRAIGLGQHALTEGGPGRHGSSSSFRILSPGRRPVLYQ